MHIPLYNLYNSIITGLVKLCHSQSNQIDFPNTLVAEKVIDFPLDYLNKQSDDQLTNYTIIMGIFLGNYTGNNHVCWLYTYGLRVA